MSKAFGLQTSKSWYPHLFNTSENLTYVGPLPDISFYDINQMNVSERSDFLAWYEEQKSVTKNIFNNKINLEMYCENDVEVLRLACKIFRKLFLDIGNIEVFLESITIASACNKVFRKKVLKPNSIGILPSGGYNGMSSQSIIAIKWMIYCEQEDNVHIQHGRKGKEVIFPDLPQYRVDGV